VAQLESETALPELAAWGELRVLQKPVWDVPVWHSLGLMTSLRVTEAYLWPEPFAETRWSVVGPRYEAAFTRPPKWDSSRAAFEWDGDPWYINLVGHAALGAELYFRPRACGHGVLASLGQATAGAIVWDYLFEASGVRPSGLDLWYTPLAGAVLGELRFIGYHATRRVSSRALRVVLQGLLDPMGQIERAIGAAC
jgi:hypothetical protein